MSKGKFLAVVCGFTTLSFILVVIVVVQAAMLHGSGWHLDYGNIPAWIGAFGTVATFLALFVAFRNYQHTLAVRQEDEVSKRTAEERKQAELVAGWLGDHDPFFKRIEADDRPPDPIPPDEGGLAFPSRGLPTKRHVNVGLLNASALPVYQVLVVARCKHDPGTSGVYSKENSLIEELAAEPWFPEYRLIVGRVRLLPPRPSVVRLSLPRISVRAIDLDIFFRDHRGMYWWRTLDGVLTEVPDLKLATERFLILSSPRISKEAAKMIGTSWKF
jgi:hypothetical protein